MYTVTGQLDRDAMLNRYSPLVEKMAHHMMAKLPPSVEVDDLIQVGLIGLVDAMSRFEASQGVQFETFASQRIKGAMLDELRGSDWLSRGSRKGQKDIAKTIARLEHRLGRSPVESEIAAEMGLKLPEYQQLLDRVRGTQILYIEDVGGGDSEDGDGLLEHTPGDPDEDPMRVLSERRMREALVEAIGKLPEREQLVMSLYYEQDMNLKEIAAVLGVTESRVSQLHSQAVARLRAQMRAH